MRLHYLQHVPFEGLGSIEPWARLRGVNVSCTHVYRGEEFPSPDDIDLLVVMGGSMSVDEEDKHPWLKEEKVFLEKVFSGNTKVLGICLGAQLIADVLGARVYPGRYKEIGWLPIEILKAAAKVPIAQVIPNRCEVFQWHGDTFDIPKGAVHLARSDACENQAFSVENKILAFQFHLETTPDSARELIENCGHELVDSAFVQPANEIMKDLLRFGKINGLMKTVLDVFARK